MSQNHCQFTGGKLLSRSQTRKRPGRKKGLLNTNSDNGRLINDVRNSTHVNYLIASASVFPCVIRRLNTEFDENSANLHLKLTSSDVRENSATDDPSCVDVTTPPRAARCSNPGETYQSLVKLKNKHSSHMFEELSKDSPHLPATPVPSRRRSAGKVLVKDTPVEEYGMTLRTRLQRRRLAKQLEG